MHFDVLSYRRFSESYRKAGDSVCIRETQRYSRRVGIDVLGLCSMDWKSSLMAILINVDMDKGLDNRRQVKNLKKRTELLSLKDVI